MLNSKYSIDTYSIIFKDTFQNLKLRYYFSDLTNSTKLIVNRSDNCNKEKLNVNDLFYDSTVMKMKNSKIIWIEENTTN